MADLLLQALLQEICEFLRLSMDNLALNVIFLFGAMVAKRTFYVCFVSEPTIVLFIAFLIMPTYVLIIIILLF